MKKFAYCCKQATIHDLRIIKALSKSFDVDLFETVKQSDNYIEEYAGIIVSPLSLDTEALPIKASKKILLSMGFDLNEHIKEKSLMNLMKHNLSSADLVVIDNPTLEVKLLDELSYKGNVFVLPYGCSINEFVQIQSPNRRNLGTNRSMSEVHNNAMIIKAIALLDPETYGEFVFVKHGPKIEEFLEKNKTCLDQIRYEALPGGNEDVTKFFLEKIDIFISASKSDGSSVSLLEAMAASKICIVMNTLTNRYWIEDGITGFCFNKSPEDLLHKIEKALNMTEVEKRKMTASARKRVELHANWDRNSARFIAMLESL